QSELAHRRREGRRPRAHRRSRPSRGEARTGGGPEGGGRSPRQARAARGGPGASCYDAARDGRAAGTAEEGRVGASRAARRTAARTMMFWDASAVVPLLLGEPATQAMQKAAAADPVMLVWWATEIECASAIAGLDREGAVDQGALL